MPVSAAPCRRSGWASPHRKDWRAGRTLLPGLVDIHCHGGNGGEFGPDIDSGRTAAAHHHAPRLDHRDRVTGFGPAQTLLDGARALGELVRGGELAGIHLEGPFLSTVRCGAQNPAALVDADLALVAALAEAGGEGAFAHMTWAPERPGGERCPAALAASVRWARWGTPTPTTTTPRAPWSPLRPKASVAGYRSPPTSSTGCRRCTIASAGPGGRRDRRSRPR